MPSLHIPKSVIFKVGICEEVLKKGFREVRVCDDYNDDYENYEDDYESD